MPISNQQEIVQTGFRVELSLLLRIKDHVNKVQRVNRKYSQNDFIVDAIKAALKSPGNKNNVLVR